MHNNELDRSDMLGVIGKFPDNIEEIVAQIKSFDISKLDDFRPRKVLVQGMGGSAIGGDILSVLLSYEANLPINTYRGYTTPRTADASTLVFTCSYSGNTEETLSAVNEAFDHGCKIIAITSGGKLEQFCRKNDQLVLKIPKGLPPRAAVAYLFFPMLMILEKMKIINSIKEIPELILTLKELNSTMSPDVPEEQNPAKQLAKQLNNGIPYIYGHTYLNIIAKRWQTQLNENSKILAMAGGFPEMNHNEIVGWAEDDIERAKQFVVVFLRSADEHPRITKRIELTKEILLSKAKKVLEVDVQGASRLTRIMTCMYLGDYTSVYLALLRGVDPTPVEPIEQLKKKMMK